VYLETKAGGTRQLTRVQRTEGDMDALRDDLVQALGVDSADVQVNRLNGHIVVKVCVLSRTVAAQCVRRSANVFMYRAGGNQKYNNFFSTGNSNGAAYTKL
jgi:hypothetical protein